MEVSVCICAVNEEKNIRNLIVALQKQSDYKVFIKEKQISLTKAWRRPRKAPGEIWLMYKDVKDFRKIISAWRYPGISKPGEAIPIPEDIRLELLNEEE